MNLTILAWCLVNTFPNLLICGFHCWCVLSNSIFVSHLDYSFGVLPPLPPNLLIFSLVYDFILATSIPSQFLHYYLCAPCNTVTFHVPGRLNFTITVDNSRTIVVFEHCLCAMFAFQPYFLHISKGILYDYNNFVSSSLYQIPTTSLQGRQWVVNYGHYCIVGDSLAHNYQETIHPRGEYSIYYFLPTHDGAANINLEQIAKFGLWQDPFLKSKILVNYFWWGCFVWIIVDAFDQSQPFRNAKHGQKVWWPCLA